ncbi:MAG: PilZ domain-containing protein [Deltaproteobacteria bacterium]|nr:PilZ domain-containing protein [Deltaproteobacteria bacterium]
MLESVDILAGGGRADLRRGVDLECQVVSDLWEGTLPHRAKNLSATGIYLESDFPLHVGHEVVLSFEPPRGGGELLVYGEVRRVEMRRRDYEPFGRGGGMGVAFDYLSESERERLMASLEGLPPPLPARPQTPAGCMRPRPMQRARELVWVDSLVTCYEDLGDRLNIWEEAVDPGAALEEVMEFESVGCLLTAPRPTPRFGRMS